MAGKTEDQSDLDAIVGDDEDDDISAALRAELEKVEATEDEEDAGGFDQPLDEDSISKNSTVTEEDGVNRVQKARDAAHKRKVEKPEEKEDEAELDVEKPTAKAKPEDEIDETKAEEQQPAQVSDEDYSKAIEALPPGVKTRITETQSKLDAILAPTRGREAELEAAGGAEKAFEYFININDYARRDPAGYLTWMLGEATGGDAEKTKAILEKAAANAGYQLTAAEKSGDDDDDDDPFMSDSERQARQELREARQEIERIKGSNQTQPQVGPDSPTEQARRIVVNFLSEQDGKGQPAYPDFDKLQPTILSLVREAAQRSGKPMTRDDLFAAYRQAELAHPDTREAATERLLAERQAAQGDENVRKEVQQKAAATQKAKAASTKIIGDPGQRAVRQPAQEDAGLSLEDFLRKQLSGGAN